MATARLDGIDWNFPGSGTYSGSVHAVHWFPGNFIPQLPSALIQALSSAGELVADPFCGSGTTALAAMELGRRAVASDQMQSSLLVTTSKVALATYGLSKPVLTELLSKLTFEHECRSDEFGQQGEGSASELASWYGELTLQQLRYVWGLIEGTEAAQRVILEGLFSEVLFQCASTRGSLTRSGKRRRHHWGWIADNVRPKEPIDSNAIEMFRVALLGASRVVPLTDAPATSVVRADARALPMATGSVDLVVTSPPYIGMIDYTHSSRMLYLWMGWSILDDRSQEIGARYRRGRKNLRATYIDDMRRSRDELLRILKSDRHCALVIGESRAFPGTAMEVISSFGEKADLEWGPTVRTPTRRRVSDRLATEAAEYLAVFRKR